MHAKKKGSIGELAVALDLMHQGYAVFTELGDLSKVDLIAEIRSKLIKIQVKYKRLKWNAVELSLKKAGPNYRYQYTRNDVDLFAVYCPDTGDICYVPFSNFTRLNQTFISIHLKPCAQKKGVHDKSEFTLDQAVAQLVGAEGRAPSFSA